MGCEFWAGLIGALVGGAISLAGIALQHYLSIRRQDALDSVRKKLLKEMLENAGGDGWMTIETLARVVGAEFDTTKRLLLEIEARGSQKDKDVWSLIRRNPLPKN